VQQDHREPGRVPALVISNIKNRRFDGLYGGHLSKCPHAEPQSARDSGPNKHPPALRHGLHFTADRGLQTARRASLVREGNELRRARGILTEMAFRSGNTRRRKPPREPAPPVNSATGQELLPQVNAARDSSVVAVRRRQRLNRPSPSISSQKFRNSYCSRSNSSDDVPPDIAACSAIRGALGESRTASRNFVTPYPRQKRHGHPILRLRRRELDVVPPIRIVG
jgi:hypothetical protein